MEKLALNLENPIRQHEKECLLKNGTPITVKGLVFDHSITPGGEPMFNLFTLTDKNDLVAGSAFFPNPMDQAELEDKVDNICEFPDDYLYPAYKQTLEN